MSDHDELRNLLIDFFGLSSAVQNEELSQSSLPAWDSLAMVQLIGELQSTFGVEFDLDQIQALRSYSEIRECLSRKGVNLAG
ncbi:MAG: acyl carrier protein [Verrucomicrobia bacterium]|nr:acyl carrier protein [Verrucomicrobiota bacterium]